MVDLQVYAKDARIEPEGDTLNVTLTGINLDEILAQLHSGDILTSLESVASLGTIADYVTERLKEV